ncbi:VIT domain-containing protein [Shewanella violacea]|uniref:Inter-alpha-trypsin inhibitor domain protein n=1 Tax=Shewanella violacea (strain JCM 10179 / CIP 106290 / LMG 19151 / DSS12) TaxID=637905 RepID=D4ZK86_SHEVD|nr:VIT domain-containing protein [Shewanella violacea]BAJ02085.1 inter-alpha-trypsin inhibitor domain protein [Shewanella violacea DSS12]
MNSEVGLTTQCGKNVALSSVSIKAKLNGILAEVDVKQKYKNNENTNIETVYTFPLPIDAVLLQLNIEINGQILEGQVKVNSVAEEQYEEAVTSGNTAVMLKKITDGLYSINLGNLLAGESAIIHFTYAQLNEWQGDRLRFYIPTTLAPKYGKPLMAGLAEHEVPSHSLFAAYQFDFQANIEGKLADAVITSPTHSITQALDAEGLHLGLLDAAQPMDRDLIIEIAKPNSYVGEGLWAKDGEQIVALTSFYPQLDIQTKRQPRCIKMVVDCSGSMTGDSINQASIALQAIVEQLADDDWFNIILFGSHHKLIFNKSVQATPNNLQRVEKTLQNLRADFGGTEMDSALQAAYSSKTPKNIPTDILLITDGQIWDQDYLLTNAQASKHRHFVVGVGSAVSEAFLSKLASETGGASEFVTPNENMSSRIVRHFERIKQPRLHDSKISWPKPNEAIQQSPQQLSPLFAGDTINVFSWLNIGKCSQDEFAGQAELNFSCKDLDGIDLKHTQKISLAHTDNHTLARLAAHSRIAEVNKTEALDLADKYQLVTESTSYILVKVNEQENELALPKLRTVPHQLPAGQSGFGSLVCESSDMGCQGAPIYSSELKSPNDYLDIPKFLRKQADDTPIKEHNSSPLDLHIPIPKPKLLNDNLSLSQAEEHNSLAESLNSEFTPDNEMGMSEFDIIEIEELGEDETIIEILYLLEHAGYNEQKLVSAWLSLYNEFNPDNKFSRHVTRLIRILCKELDVSAELIDTVREMMTLEMAHTAN